MSIVHIRGVGMIAKGFFCKKRQTSQFVTFDDISIVSTPVVRRHHAVSTPSARRVCIVSTPVRGDAPPTAAEIVLNFSGREFLVHILFLKKGSL